MIRVNVTRKDITEGQATPQRDAEDNLILRSETCPVTRAFKRMVLRSYPESFNHWTAGGSAGFAVKRSDGRYNIYRYKYSDDVVRWQNLADDAHMGITYVPDLKPFRARFYFDEMRTSDALVN